MLEPWVARSVLLSSCSSQFIHTEMWDFPVGQPPPPTLVLQMPTCHDSSTPWLPILAPPISLAECFFFHSLVVGLPCNLIFWHFWLFIFILNLFLSFFWLCEVEHYIYLHLHLCQKSPGQGSFFVHSLQLLFNGPDTPAKIGGGSLRKNQ